jgi:hypothetical protein
MDKKRRLLFTQSAFAALAVLLGILVQTGTVRVWHVVTFSGSVARARGLSPARKVGRNGRAS